MLRRIRIHLTPGTVIALVALVFALTGGAFAATGGGGSPRAGGGTMVSKQADARMLAGAVESKAKSKAKTGARGPAGPAGKNGANGAPGATGPAGPTGPAGTNGTNGTAGVEGKQGIQGIKGEEGKQGSPGTNGTTGFTETLPEKKTETGAWSFSAPANAGPAGEGSLLASLSFAIPLKQGLEGTHVVYVGLDELFEGKQPETCPGKYNEESGAIEPKAEVGYLCVYEGFMNFGNVKHTGTFGADFRATAMIFPPEVISRANDGTGATGAVLQFEQENESKPSFGIGVWAVTAE